MSDSGSSVPESAVPEALEGSASSASATARASATAGGLADGQWHRLHPATPLLKGGIALVAIIGVIVVNLRDVFINIVIEGSPGDEFDPFVWILEHDYAGLIILAILGGLVLFVAGFYVSWRMHTFRITDEQVEVRSGILFRTNRRGRLDRIQGINIVRPFLARLFGAAKLEINVAGQDANVQLAYLGSSAADDLRRAILQLASGIRAAERAESGSGVSTSSTAGASSTTEASSTTARPRIVEQRVNELLAPELDPDVAAPESVVKMHFGRLVGSLLLSEFTVFVILAAAVSIVTIALTGEYFFLFAAIPTAIGLSGYYVSRFTKSLRYSIASTPDGVRVGFGLLSTSNDTLPPGRIHAVQVTQPLLWRPAGWWEIKLNRASSSSASGAAGQANTTILPVGNIADVTKVLGLVLPAVDTAAIVAGLTGGDPDDGFTNSPPRARVLRWFSVKRNGFALVPGAVLLRRGAIWRALVVVPEARLQSISVEQGPLLRAMRLATLRLQTVTGPVSAHLGALDADDAIRAFDQIAEAAVSSASTDTSHRWRA